MSKNSTNPRKGWADPTNAQQVFTFYGMSIRTKKGLVWTLKKPFCAEHCTNYANNRFVTTPNLLVGLSTISNRRLYVRKLLVNHIVWKEIRPFVRLSAWLQWIVIRCSEKKKTLVSSCTPLFWQLFSKEQIYECKRGLEFRVMFLDQLFH